MRVKRTTVVFRRSELIANIGVSVSLNTRRRKLRWSYDQQNKALQHLPTAWKLILASFCPCNWIK